MGKLPFTRKPQTVQSLTEEPPESLETLRSILKGLLRDIGVELNKVEDSYYEGKSGVEYMRMFVPAFQQVFEVYTEQVPGEINTMRQIENVILLAVVDSCDEDKGNGKTYVTQKSIDLLRRFQTKILAYIPEQFVNLLEKVQRVSGLCDKYLLTFYDPKAKTDVEAAKLYTTSRAKWRLEVSEACRHLYTLQGLFLRSGVHLSDLGIEAVDLVDRLEMTRCPVLGMFTDCCASIRTAVDLLLQWLEHDHMYASYVESDLQTAEKTCGDLDKKLKELRHKVAMIQFRLRKLRSDRQKLHLEFFSTLTEQEVILSIDQETVYKDLDALQMNIAEKSKHKKELRRELQDKAPKGKIHAKQHELDSCVVSLKDANIEAEKLKKRLAHIKNKADFIATKRDELSAIESEIKRKETKLTSTKKKLAVCSQQAERGAQIMTTCREIYSFLTTPDAIRKIFYGMPLNNHCKMPTPPSTITARPIKKKKGSQTERCGSQSERTKTQSDVMGCETEREDALEQSMRLVARRIGSDWIKLYRSLPFTPARGIENIDLDIQKAADNAVGGDYADCAWGCLRQWRRFHRRARFIDLTKTLACIGRPDIAKVIEAKNRLHDKEPEKKVVRTPVKPVPRSLPDYLVPFYRQVERFDELRAMNRI